MRSPEEATPRNPFQVVRDLEAAICQYTGAPFCVTTNSCTMALLLAVAYVLQWPITREFDADLGVTFYPVEIPKRTYISVPMSIIHAGGRPRFRDEDWRGAYRLKPYPVWDSARWFSGGMYSGDGAQFLGNTLVPFSHYGKEQMVCLSFHAQKTLGYEQGGAILHDNPDADAWLRRARFDGRTEGVAPKDDKFTQIGWHCYMNPTTAAGLLWKLSYLPKHNEPLPNDDYPDLSQMEIFR